MFIVKTMELHQRNYLIKRSNSIRELKKSNSKKKGYFEIIITNDNKTPPSNKLRNGDLIFVAETRGGIYAKGKVIESFPVKEFESVEEVLKFSKQFKDDSYWLNKIRSFQEKLLINKDSKLKFHEYFVSQKLLPKTIPYNGPLKEYDASEKRGLAHVFFELNQTDIEYLKKPDYKLKTVHKLDSKIPGDLRLKIVSFFNQDNSIGHLIDIDHFVPKSVGGPGNIIENLVPVGFSLNRYKSDSIPRSFFQVALENDFKDSLIGFHKDIIETLKDESQFIRKSKSPKSNDLAREINTKVCSWSDIKKIRRFYREVNNKFNPDYVNLIDRISE